MDAVISVTKHLPGPSPTLWGSLNVETPRMFHLSSVWTGLGVEVRCLLLREFLPITFWSGGALELGRETGKKQEWAILIAGVHWSWEGH